MREDFIILKPGDVCLRCLAYAIIEDSVILRIGNKAIGFRIRSALYGIRSKGLLVNLVKIPRFHLVIMLLDVFVKV